MGIKTNFSIELDGLYRDNLMYQYPDVKIESCNIDGYVPLVKISIKGVVSVVTKGDLAKVLELLSVEL